MRLDVLENLVHVVARGEIHARAAQHDDTDFLRLARNGIDVLVQRLEHILGQRIEFLRTIQRESRDPAAIFPPDQMVHSEAPPYDSTSRRRAPETAPRCRNIGWLGPATSANSACL